MMRLPLIPTILVAAAVATMIGLGIWQIGRAAEKDVLRARYEQNRTLPAMALPSGAVADEALLYRRATAFCLEVTGWRQAGGKSASGRSGTRHIADCRAGAEGPGFAVDAGTSADPAARPVWRGGEVTGVVTAEPSRAGMWERLTRRDSPPRPMIVAVSPAPGLEASAAPEADAANSSRYYAMQWFFFAAAAALIYLLALRRRQRRAVEEKPPEA
jgi:cytochrome oxidase assembly protein ShyY1